MQKKLVKFETAALAICKAYLTLFEVAICLGLIAFAVYFLYFNDLKF